jgi:hypothetical protein
MHTSVVTQYLAGRSELKELAELSILCFPASIFIQDTALQPNLSSELWRLFDIFLGNMADLPDFASIPVMIAGFYRALNMCSLEALSDHLVPIANVVLHILEHFGGEILDGRGLVLDRFKLPLETATQCQRYLLGNIESSPFFSAERKLETKRKCAIALGFVFSAPGSTSQRIFSLLKGNPRAPTEEIQAVISKASDEELRQLDPETCFSLLDLMFGGSPQEADSTADRSILDRLLLCGCISTRPLKLMDLCRRFRTSTLHEFATGLFLTVFVPFDRFGACGCKKGPRMAGSRP